MTREQAEEMVMDLIQAYEDYGDHASRKSYRDDYYDLREKVVAALVTPADRGCA